MLLKKIFISILLSKKPQNWSKIKYNSIEGFHFYVNSIELYFIIGIRIIFLTHSFFYSISRIDKSSFIKKHTQRFVKFYYNFLLNFLFTS